MRIAAMFLTMVSVLCQAASFDCARAGAAAERMICSQPLLSNLDDDMARLYSAVLARARTPSFSGGLSIITAPERLRAEQRAWLAERDRCSLPGCVGAEYTRRLTVLKAAILIPQYNRWGPKSDEDRIVGIDCDQEARTLEVGYFTKHNLPDKQIPLWDLFALKTNSAPDDRGNQRVLAVHDVTQDCSFPPNLYTITIQANPVSWSLSGSCGGGTDGRTIIHKNGRKIVDEVFETCTSSAVIAKVTVGPRHPAPLIGRMSFKEYYGYER